jgi:hypothetical protein
LKRRFRPFVEQLRRARHNGPSLKKQQARSRRLVNAPRWLF